METMSNTTTVIIKNLGSSRPYEATWQAMRDFTQHRDESTPDELWVLEHLPVFTQGQAGKPEHILNAGNIPIVQTDRGGQVTYHGPGQLVVYTLINLPRKQLSIRHLVRSLENAVINFLAEHNIQASARVDAPGVYVQDAKICSLGLRIRRGCSYHGISFNVNMDLEPFSRINPCGLKNLSVTQVSDLGGPAKFEEVAASLIPHLATELRYAEIIKQ